MNFKFVILLYVTIYAFLRHELMPARVPAMVSFRKWNSTRKREYREKHLSVLLTFYTKELALIYAGFFIFNHTSHSIILAILMDDIE